MTACLVAHIEVTDPVLYQEYRARVAPTVAAHGGRWVVRGGESTALEGRVPWQRLIVIEFPSMQALQTWYRSPEYAPLIELRQRCSRGELVAVEGPPPA